jgi:hypothetical protein
MVLILPEEGTFEGFERDHVKVDPVALGLMNRRLEQSTLTIWSALDDFLLTKTAERLLKEQSLSTGES